jgi:hypothetical protein
MLSEKGVTCKEKGLTCGEKGVTLFFIVAVHCTYKYYDGMHRQMGIFRKVCQDIFAGHRLAAILF